MPKRKSHVNLRVFRTGDRILFDLKSRQTYKLNEVGLRIWSLCDGSHSEDDIGDKIVDEFDVDKNSVKKDLAEFLHGLLSSGLIEI